MTYTATATTPALPLFAWSGCAPIYGECPGVGADGVIHSLPQLNLNASRSEIRAYFDNSWALTEVLFSGLASVEAFYKRPYHQLRHPMIFYFAHPVAVYVNKLRIADLLDRPVNAEFEALFEVGVDEMRWDDLHEGEQHIWPSIDAVAAYRKQAYETIAQLIDSHPFLNDDYLPITPQSPMWALVMGFEHERIHLETSSVLMRELPIEYVCTPDAWPALAKTDAAVLPARMLAQPEGEVRLGKPNDFPSYGWDNEYGHETRRVRPFEASDTLISNGEFLEFVKDGGYTDERYWSREGWGWRRFRNIKWPTFWVQNGPAGLHSYKLRTIFNVIDLPLDWPVCVNYHEAKAYCAWRTAREQSPVPYRLLTEGEHNALRDETTLDAVMEEGAPTANFGLKLGSESGVRNAPANSKGFHDVFGNVWQWCEDHFHPLAGSKPHPYYDDFSAPCYDGEHQMILGGSFISTGDLASIWARFHFRPHFFQHAGFRIARHTDGNPAPSAQLLQNSGAKIRPDLFNKWSELGWLSTREYCEFWGKVLAENYSMYLNDKHIVDIGAGDGRIWLSAFSSGLKVNHLTLVDPNLSANAELLQIKNVSSLKLTFDETRIPLRTDTLFFKQSIHLLMQTQSQLIHLIKDGNVKRIMVLFMPSDVSWPFSDHHAALLRESCVNPCSIIESNGRAIVSKSRHSFPVSISRDAWIQMLNNRFISFLHSLSDNQLNAEMKWAEKSLPESIEFNDILECVVFE